MTETSPAAQPRRSGRRGALLAAAAGALSVVLAACSGGAGAAGTEAAPGEVAGPAADKASDQAPVQAPIQAPVQAGEATGADPVAAAVDRSIIRTASVTIQADAVRPAADRARAIAAAAGGAVTSEQTSIDPVDADRSLATLVLRVPADRLDAVLTDLAELGSLRDQTQSAVDVTGEVVDLAARVETQRASIERVRLLLSRAAGIGDIVAIESELTRREADLEALLSRQAVLADQAAQSTVTLVVLGPDAAAPEQETGFLAGLRAGWAAFVAASTALLTGLGAVLPFAALALVLGLPLLAWWRRRAPRAEVTAGSVPAPADRPLDPVG
jgi:Domain of unknown function (DUF4349)